MRLRRVATFSEPHQEPSINLTPLIDVVFVILITFILIAPLIEMDQIALAPRPQHTSTQAIDAKNPIRIYLREDDTILWQNQPVNPAQLRLFLIQSRERHPDTTPQLFPDRNTHFGTYQAVKNAVEEAGFRELDVVLKAG